MTRIKKITPDTIVDSVVEFRFESNVPSEAIYGLLYPQFTGDYPNIEKLPIVQIPEEIREKDPNLLFSPHYKAISGLFQLNFGPRVISLANPKQYTGWKDSYLPRLNDLLDRLLQTGIVKRFLRVGLRYVDFFELDIYEHLNLKITWNEELYPTNQQTYNAIVKNNRFLTRIQIVNNVIRAINDEKKLGSVIDTDTFFEPQEGFGFEDVKDIMNHGHDCAKDLFFNLLTKDFIETLKPEYEE